MKRWPAASVEYRDQHGPYRDVLDLQQVKGIGEKLARRIRRDQG